MTETIKALFSIIIPFMFIWLLLSLLFTLYLIKKEEIQNGKRKNI